MSSPRSPVSLQHIAQEAGVSAMTVSRALGGRGRIAAATAERVRQVARRLGYRPDPEVVKLMQHLRQRRTRPFQSVIVGLTTRAEDDPEPYFRGIVAGARARADRRGYRFEVQDIGAGPGEGWGPLGRVLRSRGIEGVVLLPQRVPIDLSGLLVWRHFAAVAATTSVVGPALHRVAPHHFANTLLLCRRLAGAGHRRIGLLLPREHDQRVHHAFHAAFEWHARHEAAEPGAALLPAAFDPVVVLGWLRAHRPDAVIVHETRAARDLRDLLAGTPWARLTVAVTSVVGPPPRGVCGINERPAEIGGAAVDLVASLIERRALGLPSAPATTLLGGRWVSGTRPGRQAARR